MGAFEEALPKSCSGGTTVVIFATVGTTELPFNRLVKAIDDLARASTETFVIQIGHSTYEPQYAQWFCFDTLARMQEWIAQADLVITHGGFGIISDCVRARKRIVACPRLAEFGEAVNPQRELVTHLAEQGTLVALEDVADLAVAIEQARRMTIVGWTVKSRIPELIAQYVRDIVVR